MGVLPDRVLKRVGPGSKDARGRQSENHVRAAEMRQAGAAAHFSHANLTRTSGSIAVLVLLKGQYLLTVSNGTRTAIRAAAQAVNLRSPENLQT